MYLNASIKITCKFPWLFLSFGAENILDNQLLQLCTARTAWSDSVIMSETSLITESDRRGPIR